MSEEPETRDYTQADLVINSPNVARFLFLAEKLVNELALANNQLKKLLIAQHETNKQLRRIKP